MRVGSKNHAFRTNQEHFNANHVGSLPRWWRGVRKMAENARVYPELTRIADYTAELQKVRRCGDDDRIDRAFNAVCKRIWGYTLEDFDDESLSAQDHALLDRMTWKRACRLPTEKVYDLIHNATRHREPEG